MAGHENYREYLNIRQELKEKCKENYNKKWEEEIKTIVDNSRNTKTFWNKINKLKVKNTVYTNYVKDVEGNKYYTNKEKCKLFENSWKAVFRITEEDERNFDHLHSEHINADININNNKIKPYEKVDLNILENGNYYTKEIKEEVTSWIRK